MIWEINEIFTIGHWDTSNKEGRLEFVSLKMNKLLILLSLAAVVAFATAASKEERMAKKMAFKKVRILPYVASWSRGLVTSCAATEKRIESEMGANFLHV